MVALLVTNLILVEHGGFFQMALVAQGTFYAAAGAASLVPKGSLLSRILEAAKTFVVVNVAIALAWVKYLQGRPILRGLRQNDKHRYHAPDDVIQTFSPV
ncbi:MAG: hypothetical protein DMG76_35060 [Acidobacteria bacterium]|nr:MAG: hypothetical protein DMG76_35060 [Acidobacteriota bacterium]